MLGAFFGFQISRYAGFWAALLLAPPLVGAIGALVERYGLRNVAPPRPRRRIAVHLRPRLRDRGGRADGVGKAPVDYRLPAQLDFTAFTVFSTNYPAYKLFMLLISIAIFIVLLGVLTRTRVGLIIQAALTRPNMVAMLGHKRAARVHAGLRLRLCACRSGRRDRGPALVTQSNMAGLLGPILFVVIVVGGLGSLSGAFVASLLIGLVQTFAVSANGSLADLFAAFGVTPDPGSVFSDLWNVTIAQIRADHPLSDAGG